MISVRNSAVCIAAGLLLATGAWGASMSKSDYKDARNRIASEYKTARSACSPLTGNAKDVCKLEAKGAESQALAELDATYKPSMETRHKARLAKAQSEYDVSKERCDEHTGNTKDVCIKEAKAALVSAKADAKAQRTTADANSEAAQESAGAAAKADDKAANAAKEAAKEKTDANYEVAKEKCDSSAGTAKDLCLDEAKMRYEKS